MNYKVQIELPFTFETEQKADMFIKKFVEEYPDFVNADFYVTQKLK